jgi:hypothetical protein
MLVRVAIMHRHIPEQLGSTQTVAMQHCQRANFIFIHHTLCQWGHCFSPKPPRS